MNFGELKTKVIDASHRKDMTSRVAQFIDDARVSINYRLTLELVPFAADEDTNEVLTSNQLLYFYAAMKRLHEFILEFETASYWAAMYEDQVSMYYVTRAGTEPLQVTPEEPMP